MAVTKAEKADILKELVDKFSRTKTVVFAEYRGLPVKGISDLRKRLRQKDSEFKIAKKTLLRLAAKEAKFTDISGASMEGPVAATFSYQDELAGLQVLFKFSKENEKLKLLCGVINGELLDAATIKKYAALPGREELLAKFMGSAKSPVTGFVGILHNLVAGFVRVLKAHHDKQSNS